MINLKQNSSHASFNPNSTSSLPSSIPSSVNFSLSVLLPPLLPPACLSINIKSPDSDKSPRRKHNHSSFFSNLKTQFKSSKHTNAFLTLHKSCLFVDFISDASAPLAIRLRNGLYFNTSSFVRVHHGDSPNVIDLNLHRDLSSPKSDKPWVLVVAGVTAYDISWKNSTQNSVPNSQSMLSTSKVSVILEIGGFPTIENLRKWKDAIQYEIDMVQKKFTTQKIESSPGNSSPRFLSLNVEAESHKAASPPLPKSSSAVKVIPDPAVPVTISSAASTTPNLSKTTLRKPLSFPAISIRPPSSNIEQIPNENNQNDSNNVFSANLSHFDVLMPLGQGAFATVFLVRHKPSRKLYALKAIDKPRPLMNNLTLISSKSSNIPKNTTAITAHNKQWKMIAEERLVLQMILGSPFTLQLKYAFQSAQRFYLVTDYCPGGNLFQAFVNKESCCHSNISTNPNAIKTILAEILVALYCLHSKGIFYRDLKPENVLLTKTCHVRLADFGFCNLERTNMHQALEVNDFLSLLDSNSTVPQIQHNAQSTTPKSFATLALNTKTNTETTTPIPTKNNPKLNPSTKSNTSTPIKKTTLSLNTNAKSSTSTPTKTTLNLNVNVSTKPNTTTVEKATNSIVLESQPSPSVSASASRSGPNKKPKPPLKLNPSLDETTQSTQATQNSPRRAPQATPSPTIQGHFSPSLPTRDIPLSPNLPKRQSVYGTKAFMSPEMTNNSSYSLKTDIWSFGALAYMLIYVQSPFCMENGQIKFSSENALGRLLKDSEIQFLKSILVQDPKKRLDVVHVMQLPYFGDIQWLKLAESHGYTSDNLVIQPHSNSKSSEAGAGAGTGAGENEIAAPALAFTDTPPESDEQLMEQAKRNVNWEKIQNLNWEPESISALPLPPIKDDMDCSG